MSTLLVFTCFVFSLSSGLCDVNITGTLGGTSSASSSSSTVSAFTTYSTPATFATSAEASSSCMCGVFLSGQFSMAKQPVGVPVVLIEPDDDFKCSPIGVKHCSSRCVEKIMSHVSNSAPIICGSVDRDIFKERAYLFVKNCNGPWVNTKFAAGREYCCKDGEYYKCPQIL